VVLSKTIEATTTRRANKQTNWGKPQAQATTIDSILAFSRSPAVEAAVVVVVCGKAIKNAHWKIR